MGEAIVPLAPASRLWRPGGGPPRTSIAGNTSFYILEGEISLVVGDKRLVAGPGMFANMPVGTRHSFKNETSQKV